jgi:hypothetical protein
VGNQSNVTPARAGNRALSAWHRAGAVALLFAILLGVLWTMDVVSRPPRRAPASVAPESAALGAAAPARDSLHAGRPRAFLLMLDSLRYETAIDPARMPYLAGMRPRSTYAKTLPSRDAVTVTGLRAAFTGRDRFSVFGILDNFRRRDARIESLFSQAAAAGLKIAIYSDGAFTQFGSTVGDFVYNASGGAGTEVERQDLAAQEALDAYLSGKYDLVIAHVTYGDHIAHARGIHHPEYIEAFHRLDTLVRNADQAIPATDTLVVMGDHGHDEDGRHGLGLDVPTLSLYRGPGFARGVDLALIQMNEHRYLASFALGLPLSPEYDAGRHPRALVPLGELPPAYRQAFDPLASPLPPHADFPEPERANLLWMVAYVGLLAWLWILHLRHPVDRPSAGPLASLGLWTIAIPLAFPALRPWNALCGLVLGAIWLLCFGPVWLRTRRIAAITGAAAVAAALALFGWAFLLATYRPEVHALDAGALDRFWNVATLIGIFITLRWGPMIASWTLLGAAALLFYPTVYDYGSMGALAPVWSCWVLFLVVSQIAEWIQLKRRGAEPAQLAHAGRRLLGTAALALAIFALLQPFFHVDSTNFRFVGFAGVLRPQTIAEWLAFAIVAKAIVFLRPRSGRLPLAAGAVIVAVLSLAEWDILQLTQWRGAVTLGAFLAAYLLLRHYHRRIPCSAELRRLVGLGLLWALSLYSLRVPIEARAWADGLSAVLVLSAAYAQRFTDPAVVRSSRLFLLMLGVIAAGWVTLAWTVHRLEWAFLYDWFHGAAIERNVAVFIPLLLARYALPVLIARRILAESFACRHPARNALRLGGLKFFALAMMVFGIGCYSAGTDVYVEAAQEYVILFLLLCGLTFGLGDEKEPPRAPAPTAGGPLLPQAAE